MKLKTLVVLALTMAIPVAAQTHKTPAKQNRQSFEEFRKGILSDYKDFRQKILDHYADFLEGEWHPYESYNGEKRDIKPKPRVAPRVKSKSEPERNVSGMVPKPDHKPDLPPRAIAEKGEPETSAPTSQPDQDLFDFYGLPVQVPSIEFSISDRLSSTADYASQWRSLQKGKVAERVLPVLQSVSEDVGLNDYLFYRLINSYIDSKFPETDISSRMSVIHYLLANLGYDVRIATTGRNVPLLLIPFSQTIYSRPYMMIGNRKYYIFEPEGLNISVGSQRINTCDLPNKGDLGRSMDLVLGELRFPMKPKAFDFKYGPLHLTGEVNENLMAVLYRYPQMPMGDYAKSNIQPKLRQQLATQIRTQLQSFAGDAAVGAFLEFMHHVFDYSTDEDYHGFEKPYFIEETLYYPKNDCEDRAIFYTYFLWEALGKSAQLVNFPGHEAATVCLDDNSTQGTCYEYDGRIYYISDPTYIGSRTGMVMTEYKEIDPKVDYTYK